MDQKPQRQNRITPGPRAVRRSISFPSDLLDAITEEAIKEGHHNVSRIVVSAVIDHLNRKYDPRAA